MRGIAVELKSRHRAAAHGIRGQAPRRSRFRGAQSKSVSNRQRANGHPLSALEAQKRAQAVLNECGCTWPGQTVAPEPIAAPDKPSESENEAEKPPRKGQRDTR